jgi:soluble cytochrome b562
LLYICRRIKKRYENNEKMKNLQEETIKRFEWLSDKHHKLSLLFYELAKSIRLETKDMINNNKEFKEYFKGLGLDFEKINEINKSILNLELKDLKGGLKQE